MANLAFPTRPAMMNHVAGNCPATWFIARLTLYFATPCPTMGLVLRHDYPGIRVGTGVTGVNNRQREGTGKTLTLFCSLLSNTRFCGSTVTVMVVAFRTSVLGRIRFTEAKPARPGMGRTNTVCGVEGLVTATGERLK